MVATINSASTSISGLLVDNEVWDLNAIRPSGDVADCLKKYSDELRELTGRRATHASGFDDNEMFLHSLISSLRAKAIEAYVVDSTMKRSRKPEGNARMAAKDQEGFDYTVGGAKVSMKSSVVTAGGLLFEGATLRSGVVYHHYVMHHPDNKRKMTDILINVEELLQQTANLGTLQDEHARHIAKHVADYFATEAAKGSGTRGGLFKMGLPGYGCVKPPYFSFFSNRIL